MKINTVYINTHRYDFKFTCICVASVRYWYPDIDIYLLVDKGRGTYDASILEKSLNIKLFNTPRKKFGWGYGKLEPLFVDKKHSFLVLDSDTVLTGPIIDLVINDVSDFVVDEEVQPDIRFNEIYYHLDKINQIDPNFKYPGYSFNSGQWFGTSGILSRSDFEIGIEWTEPPKSKYPEIIFKGDQSILNFIIHLQENMKKITVLRKKIMIWPEGNRVNLISLDNIIKKNSNSLYIIHWAGIKGSRLKEMPGWEILKFYKKCFCNKLSIIEKIKTFIYWTYLDMEAYFKPKWVRITK